MYYFVYQYWRFCAYAVFGVTAAYGPFQTYLFVYEVLLAFHEALA